MIIAQHAATMLYTQPSGGLVSKGSLLWSDTTLRRSCLVVTLKPRQPRSPLEGMHPESAPGLGPGLRAASNEKKRGELRRRGEHGYLAVSWRDACREHWAYAQRLAAYVRICARLPQALDRPLRSLP